MGTMRILLVDDSGAQRHIIRRLLQASTDFEVVGEAADGQEAIAQFSAVRPDLTLLDLVMPGMGGEEVLDAILDMDSGAQVIIASSLGSEASIRACLERGAASFIQKPFTGEDLARTLRSVAADTEGVA